MKTIKEIITELQKRIIQLAIFLSIFFFAGYFFSAFILEIVLKQYAHIGIEFILLNPLDIINLKIQIGLFFALLISSPFILFHILRFFETKKTKFITIFILFCLLFVLTIIGGLIGFYYVSPLLLAYLYAISNYAIYWNILSVISLITLISFCFGIIAQLLIIIPLLHITQILPRSIIQSHRKYYIVVGLILCGIITPPDALSLFILFIPLFLSIELGISLSYIFEYKNKNKLMRETSC